MVSREQGGEEWGRVSSRARGTSSMGSSPSFIGGRGEGEDDDGVFNAIMAATMVEGEWGERAAVSDVGR